MEATVVLEGEYIEYTTAGSPQHGSHCSVGGRIEYTIAGSPQHGSHCSVVLVN